MVNTSVATVEEVAQYFAEITNNEQVIQKLWTRQADHVAELWVQTKPIDIETEKRLRGVRPRIQEKFPATCFAIRLLNPRLSENTDLSFLVPRDAKPFSIH